MALSIKTRLTAWYVVLLAVSLIVSGSTIFYYLYKISIDRIDRQVTSVANMMVHTVVKPSGQLFLPRDFDLILERFFGIRTAGNYIQILDPRGQVVAKSSNLETFTLPVPRGAMEKALNGETAYSVASSIGRYPVRLVTKPIIIKDKGLVAIVQVGSSLEGLDEIFHSLFYILLVITAGSIAVAVLVGRFLAKKALKPVSDITETARRIGAENLNERINIEYPRDEIGRLASTINEMFERLEKSFKQIRQFTGDASHELKTPLTILKGEMEMALRSKGDPEYTMEVLKSGIEEIDRMNYIVRSLLDLARMDVEKGNHAHEPVKLDRIVSERSEHFRKLALDSGIRLDILKNMPAVVAGDPVRVSQLVSNLIDNAIKYTHSGGRVEVSLEATGGMSILKVRDTGVGIAREDIPFIFDRFYRVDKARSREVGGAGLGLSICKEIAVAHGGSIEVESRPGSGTLFTVRLPLMAEPDMAAEAHKTKGSSVKVPNPI